MIRYYFICENQHNFDAWFKDIDIYEKQVKEKNSLFCPICGSPKVNKKITAPALVSKKETSKKKAIKKEDYFTDVQKINQTLNNIKTYVKNNFSYVGEEFKEMALKMHKGTLEKENIYGDATKEDIIELNKEGVEVLPLGVKINSKKLN